MKVYARLSEEIKSRTSINGIDETADLLRDAMFEILALSFERMALLRCVAEAQSELDLFATTGHLPRRTSFWGVSLDIEAKRETGVDLKDER